MANYQEIVELINTIIQVAGTMKQQRLEDVILDDIQAAMREVNTALYHAPRLKFQKTYDFSEASAYPSFAEEVEQIITIWRTTLVRHAGKKVDVDFGDIYEYFSYVPKETIYQTVWKHFQKQPESIKLEFLSLPNRYLFLKGKIDYVENDYSLIREYVDMMCEKIEEYKWLYEHLADYRSKYILNGIIKYWFTFDIAHMHSFVEQMYLDYYDLDIISCDGEDVMVDLGAYIGDSVMDYVNTFGDYKKIYAYEITPETFLTLQKNVGGLRDIELRRKGVSKKNGIMYIEESGGAAGNQIADSGNVEVEVVALDEDIEEPVSVIKMDIEGAEKDAILGARRHIAQERPKLMISAYHLPGDIFDIPVLINEIREDYKFYLRFNGKNCLWPCDYVLYAV